MRRAPRSARAAACGSRPSSMRPRSGARSSSFTPRSRGRPFDRIATIRGKAAPFRPCGVDFARLYPDLSVSGARFAEKTEAPRAVATAEETVAIRPPMRAPEPARKDGPPINEEIRAREVHLIDRDGANKGPVAIAAALAAAQATGLD